MATRRPTAQKNAGQKRRWPLFAAIGLLVAVLAVGSWAAYQMFDPVQEHDLGSKTCHNTENVGDRTGIITAPSIRVRHGRWVDIKSIEMLEPVNYRLSGAGVQDQIFAIGSIGYPLFDDGTAAAAAWTKRDLLPARLGNAPVQSIIMALEPAEATRESSLSGFKVRYTNQWGIPYTLKIPAVFEAKADCSGAPETR
ncbi:hypothetical protein CQ018_12575 [Arthrobacter sp. MYb227]|uniref:hypothetical protein n=1 Tax=Arthrobacter sp. MYb227 TaxID=1848601 RepID=UPI000CFB4E33|nr:hypothetical protein [Arthrobacter sp. MYb227]PQZ92330.1 hypothetical protein CQ018_12575 [Arthrobacter sp. MYb227]